MVEAADGREQRPVRGRRAIVELDAAADMMTPYGDGRMPRDALLAAMVGMAMAESVELVDLKGGRI